MISSYADIEERNIGFFGGSNQMSYEKIYDLHKIKLFTYASNEKYM